MTKRIIVLTLVLLVILTTLSTSFAMQPFASDGTCSISKSGNTISYSGNTRSTTTEATITVSLTLKRLVSGQWQTVDSVSASRQKTTSVSATDSCSVTGGYYYKVFATHYTTSSGTWYTESNQVWVS